MESLKALLSDDALWHRRVDSMQSAAVGAIRYSCQIAVHIARIDN